MGAEGEKLRLNRAIALSGICSRRQADELIKAGRVKINGQKCVDLSFQVSADLDRIEVDEKPISFRSHLYIALNKPRGVVCTRSDEQGRQSVLDILPEKFSHLKPVGRLDMYSEGLLLLTNDGDFAQKLTHPSLHMSKVYQVQVRGQIKDTHLDQMARGVELEDGMTKPAKVELLSRNNSYSEFMLTLTEGRNRQIRRMCEKLGFPVVRLLRLAIGRLQLGQMNPGSWRYLTNAEIRLLIFQRQ